jgi:hypothetical protein
LPLRGGADDEAAVGDMSRRKVSEGRQPSRMSSHLLSYNPATAICQRQAMIEREIGSSVN